MKHKMKWAKSNETAGPSSSSSPRWPPPHYAMIELKHRILSSLSKLSDRDTFNIAVDDLQTLIQSLSNDAVPILVNCLCDAVSNDPKSAVKRESIRLVQALCTVHTESCAAYLTKIVDRIVRRLKDVDSQVRDACRNAIGTLSGLYLRDGGDGDVVLLFVRPLLEVMSENSRTSQGGAAICLSKMVECASEVHLVAFKKLCFRVVKYLNCPHFMAKASLLQLVSRLSQVGAIPPQALEPLLHGIHECLGSSDWATRKAAAELLSVISLNISNITPEEISLTLKLLEARSFDKVKTVRESMTKALQLWKKFAGGDGSSDDKKEASHDSQASESDDTSYKKDFPNLGQRGSENSVEDTASSFKGKGNNISVKAFEILKKKAPALTDKELNPGFFQKLETRVSGELPVEVIVPRRCAFLRNSKNEKESEFDDIVPSEKHGLSCQVGDGNLKGKYESLERGAVGDQYNSSQRESSREYADFSRNPGQPAGFMINNGNWSTIQKQLLLLERQQAHLMHMLQDFMGGSHDGMMTLENRVRGLERVLEDVTQDLSLSAGRRASNTVVGSKYNGFRHYSNEYLGRVNDGQIHLGEGFAAYDGFGLETKGRSPSWRSDASDGREFHASGKYGRIGSGRAIGGGPLDINEAGQIGSRRVWEGGAIPIGYSEGPSARSVWRGSKDEATLEAIRVAREDYSNARSSQTATPEMTAEALGDDGNEQERDTVWTSWRNAMDAFHVGDMDSAFAEILSSGDDLLLVKLMNQSGPVIDQLSDEVATDVLHAISQFLLEQNLFETCLHWVQQLVDIFMENGPDAFEIPTEVKREILLNLNEASLSKELTDWNGLAPHQLLLQLASAWEIDLQHFGR